MRPSRSPRIVLTALAFALALSACAAPQALRQAEQEAARGNWDAAVAYYRHALEEDPGNVKYQIGLERALFHASQQHEAIARELRAQGRLEEALREYQLAVQLDSGNQVALTGLRHVQEELTERGGEEPQLTRLEELKRQARAITPELPVLQPQTDERFSLDFRDAQIRDLYTTLARIAGLSVLFDATFQDQPATIQLDNVTFFEALNMVTRARGHFYKALSPSVFVVVPDNQNKRREYADQVMRTFFLSNAQAEAVAQRIRTMLEAQLVAEDTELNAVTIRATPEVVDLAERVVNVADKSRGEVMLDIEILEVNRRLLREYGISLTDYQVTQSLAQGEGGISLNRLRFINASDWFVTLPSIRYRLFKETGDFKLVADPHVRLTEGEQAAVIIGEQVPVVTTTFNPTQLSGNQVVPISSTVYRDVGIVLGVGARVHHNDEVTLELQIEVSSVAGTSTLQNLPIFATRNVDSVLRLRDGETNVLAGLLRDDERSSLRGIPGLSEVPLLGELFADHVDEIAQTDVILSITPHILRAPDITLDDLVSTYVGTATAISTTPGAAAGAAGSAPPRYPPVQPAPDLALEAIPEEQPREAAAAEAEEAERAGVTRLSLAPASVTVQPGDEFVLEVRADGATGLFSADLQVAFDSATLEYVDAERGPFLGQDGAQTAFQALPMGGAGVSVGITRIGDPGGISGSGTLMLLSFRALGAGNAAIEIASAALRAPDGTAIPASLQGATVEVVGADRRQEDRRAPR